MFDWLIGKPLPPGTPAPDFAARDQDGNAVALSQLRGKNVVLVFYPADETPTCRRQLCEFKEQWSTAQARNTVVFGVNPAGATSHAKFRENRKLPFSLLVDEGQRVAKLYNCGGVIIRRTVYLIGPDGVIRFAERGTPQPGDVLAAAA